MTNPPMDQDFESSSELSPPIPLSKGKPGTPQWLGIVTIVLVLLAIGGLIWGGLYAIKTREALDAATVRIQKSEADILSLRQDLRTLGANLDARINSLQFLRDEDVRSFTSDIDSLSQCVNKYMDTVANSNGYGYTYYYCDGAQYRLFGD